MLCDRVREGLQCYSLVLPSMMLSADALVERWSVTTVKYTKYEYTGPLLIVFVIIKFNCV